MTECTVCGNKLVTDLEKETKVCNTCSAGWTLFKYPENMKKYEEKEE